MDEIMKWPRQIISGLGKHKYALLVLLIGVLLLCLPTKKEAPEPDFIQTQQSDDLEERLEEILSAVDGVGEVCVLLSKDSDGEHLYKEDKESSHGDEEEDLQLKTVIVTSSGQETPIVTAYKYPVYRGAVVACQGADSASVRLSVTRAVAGATGLGADRITVIKMKTN